MIIHALAILFCASALDCVHVRTSSGVLRGTTVEALGQNINQFLGIPYAQPPVGSLRFGKPRPIDRPLEVSVLYQAVLI